MLAREKPVHSLAAAGRAAERAATISSGQTHFNPNRGVLLVAYKRGRDCTLGKVVLARPLKRLVLAQPYKSQNETTRVSVHPVELAAALKLGATDWVVQHFISGRSYRFPLAEVSRAAKLQPSDGSVEYFLPLVRFTEIPLQTWGWAEDRLLLDLGRPEPAPEREPEGRQMALFAP